MSGEAWKAFERRIAKDLGTQRNLEKGRAAPDIVKSFPGGKRLIIECKARKTVQIGQCISQLCSYGEDECFEVARVLCWRQSGGCTVQVFMRLGDLLLLHHWAGMLNGDVSGGGIHTVVQLHYDDFKRLVQSVEEATSA